MKHRPSPEDLWVTFTLLALDAEISGKFDLDGKTA